MQRHATPPTRGEIAYACRSPGLVGSWLSRSDAHCVIIVGDWKETSGEFRFKQSPVQTKNVLIELFRKGVFSMDISQIISAKALGAAVLATIVAPIAALPAHAAENRPCTTTVTRHLDGLGIDRSDVTDIFMITIPQWRAHEREDNELQAWASFRSCAGNLVVKLTTVCRVKEEYTRGGCRFDGVSHF